MIEESGNPQEKKSQINNISDLAGYMVCSLKDSFELQDDTVLNLQRERAARIILEELLPESGNPTNWGMAANDVVDFLNNVVLDEYGIQRFLTRNSKNNPFKKYNYFLSGFISSFLLQERDATSYYRRLAYLKTRRTSTGRRGLSFAAMHEPMFRSLCKDAPLLSQGSNIMQKYYPLERRPAFISQYMHKQ